MINGMKVHLIGCGNEIFILSQCDDNRAWAGDINGRGWYVRCNQIIEIENESDNEDESNENDD